MKPATRQVDLAAEYAKYKLGEQSGTGHYAPAVVAQPHQHGRPLAPQVAETHRVAVLIWQDEIGERVGALGRVGPLVL